MAGSLPENRELYDSFQNKEELEKKLASFDQFDETASWEKLVASGRWAPAGKGSKVYKLFRKNWQYAAAILVLIIGSGIFYLIMRSGNTDKPDHSTLAVQEEIVPGSNRAMLRVGDSVINLSDQKSGIVTGDNTIVYNDGERIAGTGKIITLTTPRGGYYEAVLPDGTKVWLNAASSIQFPRNSLIRKDRL